MSGEGYKPVALERAVQQRWQEAGVFKASEDPARPKRYCLSMFPYPSGQLHMGHVRTYTLSDVIARFQRLKGMNVLHPMGWDAFGLPAENAAIKRGIPPAIWTRQNIAHMKGQLQALGFSFDWSREFATCEPSYYRWEQWFFTRLFRKGLVYRKAAWVNWDPVDQTVLANEQVIDGRGWRSGAPVERRELAQWFVKITAYAQELLDGLDALPGWPEKIKTMQRNWIGRSEGVEIRFPAMNGEAEGGVLAYTTRPDTLMGATCLLLAPQHPLAASAAKGNAELAAFLEECSKGKLAEADMARLEKRGMDTGMQVRHPLTDAPLPVWVANFVLMEYGTGAIMAVPGHDQRDWEFASNYGLPILQVIKPPPGSSEVCDLKQGAYTGQGLTVNSGAFDGMDFQQAFNAIADALAAKGLGERQVKYRLRDWGVSRQRYWGCPIPMIHCDACGALPVPDADLPVVLPTDVAFEGLGSPLKKMKDWLETPCPDCGGPAVRETDTFDTFMESSWYAARFACSDASASMVDERLRYWGSVDQYVGGEEHAILHLLYARFYHKAMRDEGLLAGDEPFERLLSLGMVLQGGSKMSKSSGDAGDPQQLMEKHGADALRMAMMFAAPPEQPFEWSERGVAAAGKWLGARLWKPVMAHLAGGEDPPLDKAALTDSERRLRQLSHSTLAKCGDDYDRRLAFNTVVSAVMSLMNEVAKFTAETPNARAVRREALEVAVLALSPITPHLADVLWHELTGQHLENARWPEADEGALAKTLAEVAVQVNGKLRGKVAVAAGAGEAAALAAARQAPNVARFLEGKTLRKVVYVEGRILNFVVA